MAGTCLNATTRRDHMKIYAGIGSRETPEAVLREMLTIGAARAVLGWKLHSGGARGADSAFEAGCDLQSGHKHVFYAKDATEEAMQLAAKFHPAWNRCSPYARRLHARNMFIILGPELDRPVDEVICWTKNGGATGGTGQAIRAAHHYDIPVNNLYYGTLGSLL